MSSRLIAGLALAGALALEGQASSPDREEASEAARRAAMSAIRSQHGHFFEALDTDSPMETKLGTRTWRALSDHQRAILRRAFRERFAGMLAPDEPVQGEVAWSEVPASAAGAQDVLLGLRFSDRFLKTRWRMVRTEAGWRVRDVILTEPGISLAEATLATIGTTPARARRSGAASEMLPWLSGLAVVALIVALIAPRLAPDRRKFLYLAALAPALFFLAAAILTAAQRVREPYALEISSREPWRRLEEFALRAEREAQVERARELWGHALVAGAPPRLVAYEMGLAARRRGDIGAARQAFNRALEVSPPAPGAARELAAIAAEEENFPEAERQITRYIGETGPDPDALSLQAVVLANLGRSAEAVRAVAEARRLVGEGTRGAELEAQIRARAADAAGTVAALRSLAGEGLLDRDALRRDPAYLPIATDPIWVRFLNEKLKN